ncbi:MAG: serine--tRNA ligase, partial [Bacteroidia bacterium]|nr:serine--tRNA ligase [Bacteroidia bacterium]
MLQLQTIRSNSEEIIRRLNKRNFPAQEKIEQILILDEERRQKKTELENLLAEGNSLSKKIGELFKSGNAAEADNLKIRSTQIKEESKKIEERFNQIDEEVQSVLVTIPNAPHESVPAGKSAEDNVTVFEEGEIPVLAEGALPHWELASKYDLIDFELGNKITGAGFPVYKGKGARLQRALINFFLDEALKAGYHEIMPPLLINADSGFGTGQLPDKEGQMYHATVDDLYLIPTAEVPITNLYRDVILKEEELPIKNVGYTPCFRREAGSYGAHVRGLNRLHQFDKVEIVQIAHPDASY